MLPGNAVHERFGAEERRAPFERLADPLRDADRCDIAGANQADDVRAIHLRERVLQRATRALGRITLAPRAAGERPPALEARPAFRIEEADATDERAARALLHRPEPVAAQM